MRHSSRRGILSCVPPDQARLTILFDLQASPITGVVCDDAGGFGASFAGWMELTRAIERALDAARQSSGTGLLRHDPGTSGPNE